MAPWRRAPDSPSNANGALRIKQTPWAEPHWSSGGAKGDKLHRPQKQLHHERIISISGSDASAGTAWVPRWVLADSIRILATASGDSFVVWPSEPSLFLIATLLHGGEYQLASAAARSLELQSLIADPTARDPLKDLIVGYAHVLANERERMLAWHRRTGLALRGADAVLLQTEVARRGGVRSPPALPGPKHNDIPCATVGLELAVRRELAGIRESAGAGGKARGGGLQYAKYQEALLRAVPESFFLSFPQDPEASLQWMEEPKAKRLTRDILQRVRKTKAWSRLWANGFAEIERLGTSMSTVPENDAKSGVKLSGTAIAVAVAAVVFWAATSLILLLNTGASEPAWTRMAWVFGSIQAIAFAAAGALFGTTVAREQTQQAEKRADNAEARAGANEKLATAGRALGASLQAEAIVQAQEDQPRGRPMGESTVGPSADEAVARHARLARELFGDLL